MLIKYLLSKLVKNYNNSRVDWSLRSFGLVCWLVCRCLSLTLAFVSYIFLNTFHFSRKAWKNSAQPPRVRPVFELYPFASGGWLLHKYAVDACVDVCCCYNYCCHRHRHRRHRHRHHCRCCSYYCSCYYCCGSCRQRGTKCFTSHEAMSEINTNVCGASGAGHRILAHSTHRQKYRDNSLPISISIMVFGSAAEASCQCRSTWPSRCRCRCDSQITLRSVHESRPIAEQPIHATHSNCLSADINYSANDRLEAF